VTVLAEARNGLSDVLVRRDRAPAWRGRRTRRAAALAGWLGWVILAGPGTGAVTFAERGNNAGQPGPGHGPGALAWLAVGLVVAAALPLAPRFALLAWRLAYLGVLVTPLIPGQTRADGGYYAVLAICLAVAGVRYGPRYLWWMTALTLVPVWLWTGPDWVYPAVNTAWICGLAVVLHAVWYWRRDRRALAAQTQRAREQSERAREQRERNAVLEERARIAREMHDVVAHHMSMIAVQAETAPYRLTDLPAPAQREFAALSGAAREALTEMRRLLGVLRSDSSADGAALAPQPGLRDIPALAETARRAGAQVTLDMPDEESPLPPGTGLAAYRIVQESLSNAGRHAPGAMVRVRLECDGDGDAIRITVENNPSEAPPAAGTGAGQGPAGHGLAGMRERAALLGGTLEAGATGDGGFAVRAVLPAGTLIRAQAGHVA
jgi:signal transduction histidine kinase